MRASALLPCAPSQGLRSLRARGSTLPATPCLLGVRPCRRASSAVCASIEPPSPKNSQNGRRGRLLGRLTGVLRRGGSASRSASSTLAPLPEADSAPAELPAPGVASTSTTDPVSSLPSARQGASPLGSFWESSASYDSADELPEPGYETLLPNYWLLDRRTRSRRKRSLTLDVLGTEGSSHAVMDVIAERMQTGSKPRARTDNFKVALVVEGGGMRGAVSGAMLAQLRDMGLSDCFDCVYGSSAGAINLTYYLAGQMHGLDAYTEDLAGRHFMDLRRLLARNKESSKPALDLDFLLYKVMTEVKPLDFRAVLDSPIPLNVVASCLDSLSPVVMRDFTDEEDLLACLKASANVPNVAGPPLEHRGRRLVDAAIFEPIPFKAALADGATHVLVLCTRPAPSGKMRYHAARSFSDSIKRVMLRPHAEPSSGRSARTVLREQCEMDGLSQDQVLFTGLREDASESPFFDGSHVLPVYPGKAGAFAPVCVDADILRQGIIEGRSVIDGLFGRIVRDADASRDSQDS